MPKVFVEEANALVEFPDDTPVEAMDQAIRETFQLAPSPTFQEREAYRIDKGRALIDVGKTFTRAMDGQISDKEARDFAAQRNARFTPENDEHFAADNLGEKFLGATTELAPYMLDSTLQSVTYGELMATGATAAAVAGGAAGPQALFPEEVITVPAANLLGRSIGQAFGAWQNASQVEGGMLYGDLLEAGVDRKTAIPFAKAGGLLIGAVELLQLGQLFNRFMPPGTRYSRKEISRLMAQALTGKGGMRAMQKIGEVGARTATLATITTAFEVAEEEVQEVIGLAAEMGAGAVQAAHEQAGYEGPDGAEVTERLTETLTQSLLGFPLLGLPGSVVASARDVSRKSADLAGLRARVMGPATEIGLQSLDTRLADLVEEAKQYETQAEFMDSVDVKLEPEIVQAMGFDNLQAMLTSAWEMGQVKTSGTVGERVSQQLTRLGTFTPEQVSAYARLYESAFTALGQRAGMDPVELFGRYRMQIGKGEGATAGGTVLEQAEPMAPVFFSRLIRTIEEKMPASAPADQVRGIVKETKEEEREWLGLEEFLRGKEKVSKAELLEFLQANQVQVQEVEKRARDFTKAEQDHFRKQYEEMTGEHPSDSDLVAIMRESSSDVPGELPKFSNYQLPGGTNYRELLLTMPRPKNEDRIQSLKTEIDRRLKNTRANEDYLLKTQEMIDELKKMREEGTLGFRSPHFDEPNVLAHVRFNERTDADGKRILFIEEVQSDWHQAGRKRGYAKDLSKMSTQEALDALGWEMFDAPKGAPAPVGLKFNDGSVAYYRSKEVIRGVIKKEFEGKPGIPDAPFKKTWHELVLKRMLRYAAENGFERLAWTTGEQQAERYDLSKQIKRVSAERRGEQTALWIETKDETMIQGDLAEQFQSFAMFDEEEKAVVVPNDRLDEVIGKELASKIINQADEKHEYSGLDLKVGGEGLKAFYDQIIPSFLNKFGKRWGARATETKIQTATRPYQDARFEIPTLVQDEISAEAHQNAEAMGLDDESFEYREFVEGQIQQRSKEWAREHPRERGVVDAVHAFDLTPDLRRSALREGFALFQAGEEGPRGRLRFGADRTFNIELLKTADLSTFLHETGHFYLEVLSDLATAPEAAQDVQDDVATIRTWLGAEEGAAFTMEQHEQFARGFEAYLREGRAPSAELASAFQRFKEWLVAIYRQVRDLGVELTDEVRGAMDRLLVAPEQPVDVSFEFGENVQASMEEAAAQLPQAEQDAMALEMEAELLKERLAFRKKVGKIKRYEGGYLKEELSAIPKHYFTKTPTAQTLDEKANELGYESDQDLIEAIKAFERYKPTVEKNLTTIMQTLRAIRSAESKARTAQRQASRRLFDRLEHVLGRRMPEARAVIQRAREEALAGRVGPGSEALYAKLVKGEPLSEAERADFPGLAELEGRLAPILTRIREAPELAQVPPEQLETIMRQMLEQVATAATSQDDYAKNRTIQTRPTIVERGREVVQQVQEFADQAFVFSGTRLARINEGLKHVMRRFDFDVNTGTAEDLKRVVPMLEKVGALPPEEMADLDFALKNRDEAKVNALIAKHGLEAEFKAVRELLDELYQRAKDVKMDFGYLEAYWPRRVRDATGFMNYLRRTEHWSAIDEAIRLKEKELGAVMDNEDRAQFVNNLIRGTERSQKIALSLPANVKNRLLDRLTPEMNRFYKPSSSAIVDYVSALHNAIEQRRLFGADAQTLDASIGAYIDRLVQNGEIEASQEKAVRDILKARFEQRGTSGVVSLYKSLAYIYTMGSPIAAITQIQDLAFSLYRNGYYGTASVLGQAITKRAEVTMADLGLDLVGVEFTETSVASDWVRKVFTAIGLKDIDAVGKLTLAQAGLNRLQQESKDNPAKLTVKLRAIFGVKADAVMADLQAGRVTADVKYLLFSEVADFQPVSQSDMPEGYLRAGNWRILYMLKTYSLKLLDVYHNEVLREIQTNPAQGLKNLVRLTTALFLLGMASDQLKDWLLNRKDKDLSDLVVDNLLRLMGFTKWQIYRTRTEGLLSSFMYGIAPPVPFFDDLFRDFTGERDLPNWSVWRGVPLAGKFYYWWFGGGAE